MNNKKPILTVVIVTYKSENHIYNCLESMDKYNDLDDNLEVVIIDNTSFSESEIINQNISNKYSFRTVVKFSGGNVGFGKANNIGVELAQGTCICLLNADTIFIENIFKKSIAKFSNPNIRTLGIKLVNEKMGSELSFFFIRGYFASFSSYFVKKLNTLNYMLKGMITTGACMFVRKKDFKIVGGFNPKMFLYHEESYLSRKFLNHFKYNIFYFDNTLRLIHLEKAGKASKTLSVEYYKSMVTYYKFFNFNFKFILMLFYLKQILRKLFGITSNQIVKSEYMQIKNYINT